MQQPLSACLVAHSARSPTNPGMTPLMAAVTGGKHKVIKALLKAAPTATDIANAEGYSVMHVAADLGRDRVIQILITHGLDSRDRHEDGEYSHIKYIYLPTIRTSSADHPRSPTNLRNH